MEHFDLSWFSGIYLERGKVYIYFFFKLLLFQSLFVENKIGNGKFMILKCTSNVDTEKVHY